MVQRISTRMPAFEGVGAGVIATNRLPIGKQYYSLALAYSGVTLAQMKQITVYANNKPIVQRTAEQINKMNQHDGLAAANGILLIPFTRQNLKQRVNEEITAIPTNNVPVAGHFTVTELRVEIDIDAGASNPALSLTAEQSLNTRQVGPNGDLLPLNACGLILHQRRSFEDVLTGTAEITNLNRGGVTNSLLNRITFKPSAGNLDNLKIEREGFTLFERSKALNDLKLNNGVRVSKSADGYYTIDPTESGYGGDLLDISRQFNDLRFIMDASADATITILPDYVGLLGN